MDPKYQHFDEDMEMASSYLNRAGKLLEDHRDLINQADKIMADVKYLQEKGRSIIRDWQARIK